MYHNGFTGNLTYSDRNRGRKALYEVLASFLLAIKRGEDGKLNMGSSTDIILRWATSSKTSMPTIPSQPISNSIGYLELIPAWKLRSRLSTTLSDSRLGQYWEQSGERKPAVVRVVTLRTEDT